MLMMSPMLNLFLSQLLRHMTPGDSARQVFQTKLWNGQYFDYDSSNSGHHNSVMSDMLAGQWYCRVCDLPPIASVAQALSCFRTIHELNVVGFSKGKSLMGAVNGMRPDGSVDTCCLQSREVWTGTTYGLAAAMLHEAAVIQRSLDVEDGLSEDSGQNSPHTTTDSVDESIASPHIGADLDFNFDEKINIGFGKDERKKGKHRFLKNPLKKKHHQDVTEAIPIKEQLSSAAGLREAIHELTDMGFHTAQGIHDGGWRDFGYWFATPEGWEKTGNYRSLGYMRPLAIWAMQFSVEMSNKKDLPS